MYGHVPYVTSLSSGNLADLSFGVNSMISLLVSLVTTAFILTGCTTVVQPLRSSINADQHLTERQMCEVEVRAYSDRFKNTRDWALGSMAGVGIAEFTRKEDEYWKSSPLSIIPIFAAIGYWIDDHNYDKAVNKCLRSKELLENQE